MQTYPYISNMMDTERTTLTLLTEEDLPAMTDLSKEPDTFKYIRKLQVMTTAEYQAFLRLKLEQIRSGTGYHWAVRLKSDHTFIGAVNLNPITGTDKLQIGCQLKREYWGEGFASELTKRILTFGIDELGLAAVYGVFEKENIVSRRLLERLGFTWEESLVSQGVEIEIHSFAAPIPR